MATNEEALRRVAKARYNRDLQGALRRARFNEGAIADSTKDINGICKSAYGAERHTNTANGGMAFTLGAAPAP